MGSEKQNREELLVPPRPITGLTDDEAHRRLQVEGSNDLPSADGRSVFRIVRDVLSEPMFGLLLGAAAIYLVLGSLPDALTLLAFALLAVSIGIVQEVRSERVLEALRDMTSPRALVVRNGVRKRVAGREVVRGDVVVLLEGDRVPADATLLISHNLLIDESLLTGESVPVRKVPTADTTTENARPGGEDQPFLYSGTLVVRGEGMGLVHATGPRSEIGKIGDALRRIATTPPRLQSETRRLVRNFAVIGFALSLVAVVLYGTLRGDWLQAVLGGIALGMSMLPQEFPLVLSAFMVMGAWRLSKVRVLTRRAAAIERLGSATVLCTDKTGTLTENRMTIVEVRSGRTTWRPSMGEDPAVEISRLLDVALLASARDSFDPMERAIAQQLATDPGHFQTIYAGRVLEERYGLRPDLMAMTNVWRSPDQDSLQVAAKGAPEAIASLCALDAEQVAELRGVVNEMAAQGLRVLGVASASYSGAKLPQSQRGFNYTMLGLVGFADPLRPSVPGAVRECKSAGIRVVMITGDYPATAEVIAARAGLEKGDTVAGNQLAELQGADLAERVSTAHVFARIMPEQKLQIVDALKERGEVVAMTGDGVNDAPALKSADIGIAMGTRGTDVAREASSIVLLDDDFGSIVRTIRIGRRIYDNLRKAMAYIVAVHVPIAGLALLPLLFGLPLILTPIHIAFLEMVIDPACSIVFEAEPDENDLMSRPPRAPNSRLLSTRIAAWCALQGTLAFIVVSLTLAGCLIREMPEDEMRALVFVSLVLVNVSLIMVNRSFRSSLRGALGRPNTFFWVLLTSVSAILAVTLTWPPAMALFRFGPLHLDDVTISLAGGATILIILEIAKRRWRSAFAN